MIPIWIVTAVIVVLGSIASMWLGSTLPMFDPTLSFEIVFVAAACIICAVINDFPLLLAIGCWMPMNFPVPLINAFPALAVIFAWMVIVLFFRLCVQGYVNYVPSFTWLGVILFMWVPIRFLMSPVQKVGGIIGGSGTSGAMPYFLYAFAGLLFVLIGAVITSRKEAFHFLRWCLVVATGMGAALLACAFIPATHPYLSSLGFFTAGDISEGVQRIVVLPSFGIMLTQAALCPAVFRLPGYARLIALGLGAAMVIVGGNRVGIMSYVILFPVAFFVRRKPGALVACLAVMAALFLTLQAYVASVDIDHIPGMMRGLGVFNSKIDKASGGDASAEWRYRVWADGKKKIMESPLTGNGFGNLPERFEGGVANDDYEMVLAGGMAHNGFIDAAYGFGIPFMLGICLCLIIIGARIFLAAFRCDKHDLELRDAYAFFATQFAVLPIYYYTFCDLSASLAWAYGGVAIVLMRLERRSARSKKLLDRLPSASPVAAQATVSYYRN